ncbi:MAG: zinc ABC transporter substrate-binding protein [Cellulomonas sp. 73-145]|nr:zinc ABC transporter substrate-binding protein [Cellulomonas sp.]OJV58078.1 MAG: zinc ABC transporter substrate-binding protein [Cellulomonas sp. 73-145]
MILVFGKILAVSRRRIGGLAAAVVVALSALTACGTAGAGGTLAGAPAGKVRVLASFYPLQFVAQQVGGDRVHVDSLTPPGAEPHDVELSPAQVSAVETANLVVYLSGFQAAVDDAVRQVRPRHVLDAALHAGLMDLGTEQASEGADPLAGTGAGTAATRTLDPHFWLDPSRLPALADDVATALSQVDPAGAADYRAAADRLAARFTSVDTAYRTGLADCRRQVLVTSHEAFGYLALRYHLQQVGISGLDPETEPSPARLAQIGDVVRREGVTTIFFETLASPKVARTLASDLGVQATVLDPMESITAPGADYFSVAQDNLATLRTALGCA